MITINNFFEKVYLINLKSRPDRLKISTEILNRYNIKFEIFEAIEGNPGIITESEVLNKKPGAMGCLLSHLEIIKLAKANKYKNILIFEDDVELIDNFNIEFNDSIKELPNEWDMIYLGGSNANKNKPLEKTNSRIQKTIATNTTSSYGINSNIYDLLILEISKYKRTIDSIYSTDIQKKINAYITNPRIAWQRPGFSDIANAYRNYTNCMK